MFYLIPIYQTSCTINSSTHPLRIRKNQCRFPSPAQDYVDKALDMNEHLIKNATSTFIVKVASLSMLNAGIDIDDELIVDRSLDAKHGDIVIALIDNEFTVKRLMIDEKVNGLKQRIRIIKIFI